MSPSAVQHVVEQGRDEVSSGPQVPQQRSDDESLREDRWDDVGPVVDKIGDKISFDMISVCFLSVTLAKGTLDMPVQQIMSLNDGDKR